MYIFYRVTTLNVTRIWITLAFWAAMVSTAKFSLSGSRLLSPPGRHHLSMAPYITKQGERVIKSSQILLGFYRC